MACVLVPAIFGWLCLAPAASGLFAADEDLTMREELAMRKAVERVAPSVVSIEVLGGREQASDSPLSGGPTTGLIVSADGYIVSSSFSFAEKPTSVLVHLPGGARVRARVAATDSSRMLVLLKVAVDESLPVPEAVPDAEMQVGQWSIAVGRTFDTPQPNVSVGIVSAVNRIWGKALQTDAKISPNNYGGPLIDIRGRVLGVLAPLSPTKGAEASSVEWYDSGIGFAVPLTHINEILPRLEAGENLKPGLIGISLAGRDMYADAPVIAACRPNSPAYKSGFKVGDKIVQVAGRDVVRQSQLMYELNRRYAGDRLRIAVMRGDKRLEQELEMVDHLEPYQRPFLGILPRRDAQDQPDGVVVRFVYPGSPADKAGMQPGDKLVSLSGKPVTDRFQLAEASAAIEVGQKTAFEIERGGMRKKLEATWAAEPSLTPGELPPAVGEREPFGDERPAVGSFALKVPEFKNDALAYVPADYDPRLKYGVLVWFAATGEFKDEDVLTRWKPHCDQQHLLLLAPKPAEGGKWQRSDVDFIVKALDQLRSIYQTDSLRIVAGGREIGGALAYAFAFANREQIRGVAAIDAPLGEAPPDNDPVYRLDFYLAKSGKSQFAKSVQAAEKLLKDRKYAVAIRDLGAESRDLNEEELGQMLRWIDALDKF